MCSMSYIQPQVSKITWALSEKFTRGSNPNPNSNPYPNAN